MTIVLGRRPAAQPTDSQQRRAEWVNRFREGAPEVPGPGRAVHAVPVNGPSPVPLAEIRGSHRGVYASNRRRRAAAPNGVVGMYAARLDVQSAERLSSIPVRPVASVRVIGRGSSAHYEQLHPAKNIEISAPHLPFDIAGHRHRLSDTVQQWVASLPTIARPRISFAGISRTQSYRLANSRRALYASMAALVLMVGMATSTFAQGQLRYEVEDGDTLDSIALEFGVDSEAIYRSSWMPYGYDVAPGQVLVIPQPGQSPEDAAIMAADLEGTSPWAVGAHEVVWGDTFATIAAAWGVPVDHLVAFNPDLDPANLQPGNRVIIPWERDAATVSPEITGAPIVLLNVPNYSQIRNLSCEYAATHAATTLFGSGVSEQTFIDSVPLAANPHNGYRGNIDGAWGNTDDYGVYAEALVPVLAANGYVGEAFYSEGETDVLIAHLDAGHPVVAWLGFWGDTRVRLSDDGTYSVFAGMHVVTVVGYDDLGVYVMDPAKGATVHYDWATFSAMWGIVDGMGLAVYPQ